MLALMQRKDKQHYVQPAFWAPFVVVGEGNHIDDEVRDRSL